MEAEKNLKRTELYELVWQEPLRKLAPRFGLSDVGLAKICRKHQVPTPPVGYWTRVAHGSHGERPDLPDLEDEDLAEIRFFRRQFFSEESVDQNPTKVARHIVVNVSERLHRPHPSVARVKQILANRKPAESGLLHADESCLNVAVSKAALPRTLRILDAVTKAWEQEGGRIEGSGFGLAKNIVQVNLREQTRRVIDESNKSSYWTEYKYELTGKLSLEIEGYCAAGLRKTWADGKVQRLEGVLGNFIRTLPKWMECLQERRLDEECRTRQKQAAAKRRQRVQEKQQAEQKRRDHLHAVVERWKQASDIKAFLEVIDSADERDNDKRIEPSGEWVDWIRWYADYLCPLTTTPVRDEFVEKPENAAIAGLQFTKETSKYLQNAPYKHTDELHAAGHEKHFGHHPWSSMRELRDVLEGLGYEVDNFGNSYY